MEKLSRKEQKDLTRTSLLVEAQKLFSKKGIFLTTTADIVKSLGLSHGTLFVHFPTRDDLVVAVVDEFGKRLHERLNLKITEQLKFKEMLRAHLQVLAEFENFYQRLISETVYLPTQVRSLVFSMNSALSYRFYKAAKELMKENEIKKLSQASLFNSWLALVHFYIMNRDLFSEDLPILKFKKDEIISQYFFLIEKGEK